MDKVDVRLLSCGTEKNVPLFFTDMVGIASGIDEGKRELAFELANVLVIEEVLTKASMPAEDGASPQYLLTARRSVYDFFSKDYPMYATLLEGVNSADAHVFRMGADARRFLGNMAEALTE